MVEGGDERRLRIVWRETGVAMPSAPPARRGYGSALITRALPDQMGLALAQVGGCAHREALDAVRRGDGLDGAWLDVKLGGEMVWPVVEILTARGVPVVLSTGYDVGMIPSAYSRLVRCEKPMDARAVVRALVRAISEAEPAR